MAVEAKFSGQPLQVVETPEMRARIEKIATDERVSQASVIRDILGDGIDRRERQSKKKMETKK
jgi:hypothetical protein